MQNDAVALAYFGGAAFKITTAGGKKILIDPFITKNPLCRKKLDYFLDADLMLVSHGAFDHLGDTVQIMRESKATLICGADVGSYCLQKNIPKERVKTTIYGDEKEFMGIRIKVVEAKHSSKVIEDGKVLFYGMPMGFIISTENGIRIYHTGDTALFGDLRLIGMLYRPHILLIGVSNLAEGLPCEMSPTEAALATLWVAPDAVLPIHYPPGSEKPQKFYEAVRITAPNVEPIMIEPNRQIIYRKSRIRLDRKELE